MRSANGLLRHQQALKMALRSTLVPSTASNLSLSYRRFANSSSSSMPTPLTREMLISSDYGRIAAARPTMFELSTDSEGITEVPVPASVRETGIIPDGYSVDFILDPSTAIAALKKQGIVTVEQLSAEGLKEIKDAINTPENLMIIPTSIHALKRELEEMRLAEE